MKILLHYLLYQLHAAKAWTFYTGEECRALEYYAAGKRRLVEIGCWQGVNTSRLRRAMTPDGILFAIDPYLPGRLGFNASQHIAHCEVNKIRNGEVKWLRMTDLAGASWFEKQNEAPVDLIFSDSLNTYDGFKACWEAWNPKLRPGGVYILANSSSTETRDFEKAGSVQFTRNVILKDKGFKHLKTVGTFTILEKIA